MAILLLFLIGVTSAIIGSLIGLGGGVIIVPALMYLSPYLFDLQLTTAEVVGTSLVVLIFTALSSTLTFARQKRIDYKSGMLFFITSGPGAIVGAMLTGYFESGWFQLSFGIFMFLMTGLIWLRDRMQPLNIDWKVRKSFIDVAGTEHTYGYSTLPALVLGFAVGIVSGLFGIGGGALFVPVLLLLFRFPPHVATATSMFVILLSSVLGSFTKVFLGEVHFMSILALAPGSIVGGWLGAKIAGRLGSKKLVLIIFISFLLLATHLVWDGFREMF